MPGDLFQPVEYPPMIRGSLRLMLQLKDLFLTCFNMVEEYRDQLLACQRGFARDLVVYQLTQGLAGITRLREDLASVESKSRARMNRNAALRQYLLDRYSLTDGHDLSSTGAGMVNRLCAEDNPDPNRNGTGTAVLSSALPPPVATPDSVEAALHGGLDTFCGKVNVDVLQIPEEVDLANATTENGHPLLPVVDFYRSLYFLQMHFQLIMCQAANYAMPVVTRSMSLAERAFSWPTMPSFGVTANAGTMKDRLLEITTEVVQLGQRLLGCMALVREKITQDRKIESYFFQHTAAQEAVRRSLLRNLQAQRIYIDCLESQNDRLAGLAIKLDPSFAKTEGFLVLTGPTTNFRFPSGVPSESPHGVGSDLNKDNHGSLCPAPVYSNNESGIQISSTLLLEPAPSGPGSGISKDRKGCAENIENIEADIPEPQRSVEPEVPSAKFSSHRQSSGGEANRSDKDPSATDVNYSASGGGQPPIWAHQRTALDMDEVNRRTDRKPVVDVAFSSRLEPTRGNIRAVEELLIGVDSVASGTARLGTEVREPIPTPSFLNTEHYVTSIADDFVGSVSNDPANGIRGMSKTNLAPLEQNGHDTTPKLCTPSTKFSLAEMLTPTISVNQHAITVASPNSGGTVRNSATPSSMLASGVKDEPHELHQEGHNVYHDDRQHFGEVEHVSFTRSTGENSPNLVNADYTDNTLSELPAHMKRTSTRGYLDEKRDRVDPSMGPQNTWDTNVNASDLVLPKIFPRSKHYVTEETSPVSRTGSKSVAKSSRAQKPATSTCPEVRFAEQCYLKPTEAIPEAEYSVQPVPLVATADCGASCVPDWISLRASRENRVQNLLEEPKRSAISKAMMTHRFRLVETILQADEERLEDLISLLLNK